MNNISSDIMSQVVRGDSPFGWTTWHLTFGGGYEKIHITQYTGAYYYLWENMDSTGIMFRSLDEALEAMYVKALLQQK